MDEAEELIRLCVRALVAQMSSAPGFELRMTQSCVLSLTAEPLPDFNVLTIGADPNAEAFLVQSVARAKERGSPLMAMMSPLVVDRLAPVATRLGLTAAGIAPLMILRADTPVTPTREFPVVRALGPELVRSAGDLIAAAFEVPRDAVARCIDVGITETAGVETYLAFGSEGPVSTVSVTPSGNIAGISIMATAPRHQGMGMGRALLAKVVADYRRRGVERFYLTATEPGRHLYLSIGFEQIADLSAWVLG